MSKNRTRNNELKIFLSDHENMILESKWKSSGLPSKSSFIRNLIIYGFVYDIDYSELKEYTTALSKIGNNINQIARKVNTNNAADSADIKEVKEMMNKLWHTQKSMLSKQPLIKQ